MMTRKICDLDFSKRTKNALAKAGVNDVSSLLSFSEKGLKKIEGIGDSALKEIKIFLIQNDLKLQKEKVEKKSISREVASLAAVFINRVIFVPEMCEMGKEIKLFCILYKKFPHSEFWVNYPTPKFKPRSLLFFFGAKGKEQLQKEQDDFSGKKFVAQRVESSKENKIDFLDEKLGEDIVVKKPSIEDFFE